MDEIAARIARIEQMLVLITRRGGGPDITSAPNLAAVFDGLVAELRAEHPEITSLR